MRSVRRAGASVPLALATAQRSEALEKFELPIEQLSSFERADQVRPPPRAFPGGQGRFSNATCFFFVFHMLGTHLWVQ